MPAPPAPCVSRPRALSCRKAEGLRFNIKLFKALRRYGVIPFRVAVIATHRSLVFMTPPG